MYMYMYIHVCSFSSITVVAVSFPFFSNLLVMMRDRLKMFSLKGFIVTCVSMFGIG